MAAQVLQQGWCPLRTGQTRCSAVSCHQMSSISKLCVVLLATLLTVEELPAGCVALLKLALQMVLLMEHGLTGVTVQTLLVHRDSGQEPEQT